MGQRTYSPDFKLQVVLEALQSDGTDAEVARAYDIHPADALRLENEAERKRLQGLRFRRRAEGEERQNR
ncbi:transposase [Salinibacter ruber]|uniref:transposase n=1 Tax=Salinibacter ruber TaxID=146919 RepID=UPI00355BF6AA